VWGGLFFLPKYGLLEGGKKYVGKIREVRGGLKINLQFTLLLFLLENSYYISITPVFKKKNKNKIS